MSTHLSIVWAFRDELAWLMGGAWQSYVIPQIPGDYGRPRFYPALCFEWRRLSMVCSVMRLCALDDKLLLEPTRHLQSHTWGALELAWPQLVNPNHGSAPMGFPRFSWQRPFDFGCSYDYADPLLLESVTKDVVDKMIWLEDNSGVA